MSQENVDMVEKAIAALNAGDIDGYLACCTDGIELATPLAEMSGVYQGKDAIRRWFGEIGDLSEGFRASIERIEVAGTDQVLAFMHLTGRGRTSGVPLDNDAANVY